VGAEINSQVPREIRESISSSMAFFQAGINKASSQDLGINSKDKDNATDKTWS